MVGINPLIFLAYAFHFRRTLILRFNDRVNELDLRSLHKNTTAVVSSDWIFISIPLMSCMRGSFDGIADRFVRAEIERLLLSFGLLILTQRILMILGLHAMNNFFLLDQTNSSAKAIDFVFEQIHISIFAGPSLASIIGGLYLCYFVINFRQNDGFVQTRLEVDAEVGKLIIPIFFQAPV